ncbi:uncharacterized protein B0I36DRAFT_320783 [Microdochium trichocladiopsis]|uniref:Uncharacterized protein n=1 Tax=Microdochium trichocladiopsis TaxID=1682393 RepID=A0A9P8YB48_9PEZI|nr:uncharacterized protein B0I36DRAFT_320783 [Microdochium trichocladiopsis]KAH7033104.1 hypothetical protein B0I36DRAFT_320783 [Microdochium trichocladiopsis]
MNLPRIDHKLMPRFILLWGLLRSAMIHSARGAVMPGLEKNSLIVIVSCRRRFTLNFPVIKRRVGSAVMQGPFTVGGSGWAHGEITRAVAAVEQQLGAPSRSARVPPARARARDLSASRVKRPD